MPKGRPLSEQQSTIRIPLYSAEDQKYGFTSLTGTIASDQFLVNCFPVTYQDPLKQDGPRTMLVRRPGWSTVDQNTDATTPIVNESGAFVVAACRITGLDDEIILVYDDENTDTPAKAIYRVCVYNPADETLSSLGEIIKGTDYASDTFIHLSELSLSAGNTPAVGIVLSCPSTGKSDGWYITSVSGTFTGTSLGSPIADTDFPPNNNMMIVGPFVQLNENIYIMTKNGYIYNTALDGSGDAQMANWDTEGNVPTSVSGDNGVGLVRYKHHLVAFGEETMEFFNDEGIAAPAAPIAPTQQAFINVGAAGQYAFTSIQDTLYWLSLDSTGQTALYKLDGYTPVKLSSPYHSMKLGLNAISAYRLSPVYMQGVLHLVTNMPFLGHNWFDDGDETGDTIIDPANEAMSGILCYCIDSSAWWIWAEEFIASPTYVFTAGRMSDGPYNQQYSWLSQAGDVSTYGIHARYMQPSSHTSRLLADYDAYRLANGTVIDSFRIPVMISTSYMDFGNNKRKFLRSVEVICDEIDNAFHPVAPTPAFWKEGLVLTVGATKTDRLEEDENPEIIRAKQLITDIAYTLSGNYTSAGTTALVVNETISSATPSTGFVTIVLDSGDLLSVAYTSWTGSTFTISSTDFSGDYNASDGNAVDITFIENPPQMRYYYTNFGSFRRIRFFILINSFFPVRFEALEVTLAQGTH